MGGHGGLNILPQKRWNVYNFDNREKVKKDEEAAAKEEQLKREQSRKRDTELRLEELRTARGLAPTVPPPSTSAPPPAAAPVTTTTVASSDSKHMNLFDGIKIFDLIDGPGKRKADEEADGRKKKMLKMMREKVPEQRVVTEEDEKYRLGYGVVGKGAKLPWYVVNPSSNGAKKGGGGGDSPDSDKPRLRKEAKKSGGKKTIEELREERLSRESLEKARTQALIQDKNRKDVAMPKDRYFSRR